MSGLFDETRDNSVKSQAGESVDEKLEKELEDGQTI